MNFSKLKGLFLRIMIGCLIASGMIAVVTVLTGHFNEIFGRSLVTILLIALHALVSFGYIDISEKKSSETDLTFFNNTTFILIILSFITSIFGVWGVISGDLLAKLYGTYFILLFAVLHGETLSKMVGNDKTIDNIVYTNYGFMAVVVLLLMPIIYSSDVSALGDVYYRFLAAFGIIDAILTLLAIILNKLYLQKHPKTESPLFGSNPTAVTLASSSVEAAPRKRGMSILVIILIGFLGIQLLGSLVFAVIGKKAATNARNINTNSTANVQSTTAPNTNPITFSPSYTHESDFPYNEFNYTCTIKIAGTWLRVDSVKSNGSSGKPTFVFLPANQDDLTNYCSKVTPNQ